MVAIRDQMRKDIIEDREELSNLEMDAAVVRILLPLCSVQYFALCIFGTCLETCPLKEMEKICL